MVAHNPLRGSGRAALPHPGLALSNNAKARPRDKAHGRWLLWLRRLSTCHQTRPRAMRKLLTDTAYKYGVSLHNPVCPSRDVSNSPPAHHPAFGSVASVGRESLRIAMFAPLIELS
jgi:hypothetical protein